MSRAIPTPRPVTAAMAVGTMFDTALLQASRNRLEAQRAVVLSFNAYVRGCGSEPSDAQLEHYAMCAGAEERLRRNQVRALLGRIANGSATPPVPRRPGLATGAE